MVGFNYLLLCFIYLFRIDEVLFLYYWSFLLVQSRILDGESKVRNGHKMTAENSLGVNPGGVWVGLWGGELSRVWDCLGHLRELCAAVDAQGQNSWDCLPFLPVPDNLNFP